MFVGNSSQREEREIARGQLLSCYVLSETFLLFSSLTWPRSYISSEIMYWKGNEWPWVVQTNPGLFLETRNSFVSARKKGNGGWRSGWGWLLCGNWVSINTSITQSPWVRPCHYPCVPSLAPPAPLICTLPLSNQSQVPLIVSLKYLLHLSNLMILVTTLFHVSLFLTYKISKSPSRTSHFQPLYP